MGFWSTLGKSVGTAAGIAAGGLVGSLAGPVGASVGASIGGSLAGGLLADYPEYPEQERRNRQFPVVEMPDYTSQIAAMDPPSNREFLDVSGVEPDDMSAYRMLLQQYNREGLM